MGKAQETQDDDLEFEGIIFEDDGGDDDDAPPPSAKEEPTSGQDDRDRLLADAQAKIAAMSEELTATQKRAIDGERGSIEWQMNFAEEKDVSFGKEITELNRKLIRAKEDGETEKELELQEQLDEIKAQRVKLKAAKDALTTKAAKIKESGGEPEKKQASSGGERPIDAEAEAWVARNTWFNAPKTSEQILKRHHYLETDKEMYGNSAYRQGTREYYNELDRKVAEKMKTTQSNNGGTRRSPTSPAPGSNGGDGQARDKNSVTINKSAMRLLGLDPNDKEHVAEYARNLRATAADADGEISFKYPVR
jgi:hypothetical protein